MTRPILCLDFDGVIHSYTSGWKGADVIPDAPVPGAMAFIIEALQHFRVAIFSSRSHQTDGVSAMQKYLLGHIGLHLTTTRGIAEAAQAVTIVDMIEWPAEKPPALVTIDDRAITFTGEWPAIADLLAFKPWNKK